MAFNVCGYTIGLLLVVLFIVGQSLINSCLVCHNIDKRIVVDYLVVTDKRYYLCLMRLNGTKYDEINELPVSAMPVSLYAKQNNTAVGYVYIKYERFLNETGKKPPYSIRCFKGSNYILPE